MKLATLKTTAKSYQAAVNSILQKTAFQVAKEFFLWIVCALSLSIYFGISRELTTFYWWLFVGVFVLALALMVFLGVGRGHTWIRDVGFVILFVATWVAVWGIYLRSRSLLGLAIVVSVACVVTSMIWKLKNNQHSRIRLRAGLIGIPLLAGWFVSSMLHLTSVQLGFEPYDEERSILQLDTGRQARFEERLRWRQAYPRVTVAVALSGGGYRAAAIHAGVLRALDELEVPIHYLTTVSGGSIIGAFYSLGYAPGQFQALLAHRRPGLLNDLLETKNYLAEWLGPSHRNSDTYAAHLSRTYFAGHTLADTIRSPIPLINVTEFNSARRWVLAPANEGYTVTCSDHPSGHECNGIPISYAVAASGAFPGVFEPVQFPQLKNHQFTDGGVAENLGLAGLREYFLNLAPTKPRPNIVIISDASKELIEKPEPSKWFILTMLNKAANSGPEAHHQQLYADFTHDEYRGWVESANPEREVRYFHADQGRAFGFHSHEDPDIGGIPVYTIVLDPTNESELNSLVKGFNSTTYSIPEVGGPSSEQVDVTEQTVRDVRLIATLKELSQEEVAAAGWLGEAIVARYKDKIIEALREASTPLNP